MTWRREVDDVEAAIDQKSVFLDLGIDLLHKPAKP